jgi:hypothetical protein
MAIKPWRNRIWEPLRYEDHPVGRNNRLEVTAEERRTNLAFTGGRGFLVNFQALAPKFASRYGGHEHRWTNCVRVKSFERPERIATVLPFNICDREWPRMNFGGESTLAGSWHAPDHASVLASYK